MRLSFTHEEVVQILEAAAEKGLVPVPNGYEIKNVVFRMDDVGDAELLVELMELYSTSPPTTKEDIEAMVEEAHTPDCLLEGEDETGD